MCYHLTAGVGRLGHPVIFKVLSTLFCCLFFLRRASVAISSFCLGYVYHETATEDACFRGPLECENLPVSQSIVWCRLNTDDPPWRSKCRRFSFTRGHSATPILHSFGQLFEPPEKNERPQRGVQLSRGVVFGFLQRDMTPPEACLASGGSRTPPEKCGECAALQRTTSFSF